MNKKVKKELLKILFGFIVYMAFCLFIGAYFILG